MEKWRNLCCMSFRYYLLNYENVTYVSRTYQSNYRRKLKLSWNFTCKNVYFIRFNSCQTVCFCSNTLRAIYNHLLSREERTVFVDIFTSVLKRFRHFVLSKLSLFKNSMQYKLMCISRFWRHNSNMAAATSQP